MKFLGQVPVIRATHVVLRKVATQSNMNAPKTCISSHQVQPQVFRIISPPPPKPPLPLTSTAPQNQNSGDPYRKDLITRSPSSNPSVHNFFFSRDTKKLGVCILIVGGANCEFLVFFKKWRDGGFCSSGESGECGVEEKNIGSLREVER